MCLEATSLVGFAHGLATTPEICGVNRIVSAGNTSLDSGVSVYADSTTIYFQSLGGNSVWCNGWAAHVHTFIR